MPNTSSKDNSAVASRTGVGPVFHLGGVFLAYVLSAYLAITAPSIPSEGLGGLARLFDPIFCAVIALALELLARLIFKHWSLGLTIGLCLGLIAEGSYIHYHPGWSVIGVLS